MSNETGGVLTRAKRKLAYTQQMHNDAAIKDVLADFTEETEEYVADLNAVITKDTEDYAIDLSAPLLES